MSPSPPPNDPLQASADWESSARSYANAFPALFASASGGWLIDVSGKRYLDFLTGAGVHVLGHNHPKVCAAIAADREPLVNGLDLLTTAKLAFVEALRSVLPGRMADTHKLHFCGPTGSDAIEAAMKLAYRATGRRGVIAFSGGYHGMTQGALSLTSSRRLREAGLLYPGAVSFCAFPYPLRFPPPFNTPAAATAFCLAQFELMLEDDHSGVDPPGLVMIEAVQGEGGNHVAPPDFLQRIAALCRKFGILLALDEIQSGMGRTGRWFAFEHAAIEPDIVCLSKGVGGGYPLSLLLFDRRLDCWNAGDHIGTFRGQQIAMTAGRATLQTIASERLVERAATAGARLKDRLQALAAKGPVAEVRGVGLMLGFEMAADGSIARKLQQLLFNEGVIVETGGRGGRVVRILPPLTVSDDEIEYFLAAFERVLPQLP